MALVGLTRALTRLGVTNTVVTYGAVRSQEMQFHPAVKVRSCGPALFSDWGIPRNSQLIRTLRQEITEADVIHLHELWHAPRRLDR